MTKLLEIRHPMKGLLQILGIAFVLSLLLVSPYKIQAQLENDWTIPKQIPGYDIDASAFLVTDSSGTVHAFSTKLFGAQQVAIYSSWVYGQGWTDPIDIILPPQKGIIRLRGVVIDSSDVFHLTFFSGDETGADYYYTNAPVIQAGNASAWMKPLLIGSNASIPTTAAFTIDSHDNLLLLYSGDIIGNGLYAVTSLDRGETWTQTPVNIFQTYNSDLFPTALQLYTDDTDVTHAVWSVVGSEGTGLAVHYANLSGMDSRNWSTSIVIAESEGYEADTPSIIKYEGELFLVYHNQVPTKLFVRRSKDGGQTWLEPERVAPQHVGGNGPGSFVIDGNNKLHMFFGNRTGVDLHGMWYVTWENERWSTAKSVVSKTLVRDIPGGLGFDPSFAEARVLLGNLIFITWVTDPDAGKNGVWYVYNELSDIAPAATRLPVTSTPTPTPSPSPTPKVEFTPTPALPRELTAPPQSQTTLDQQEGIVLSVSISMVISLIAIGYFTLKSK